MRLILFFLFSSLLLKSQGIKVEYDKNSDFSIYKSFSFGESQVITPPDQKQVSDAVIDKWVKNAVTRELEHKGLKPVKEAADLVVTYAVGTMARSDMEPIGPLGQTPGTPGTNATSWSRNYQQTSLIIDLNNKSNFLVWRINSFADMVSSDAERTIDSIVERGFKKFGKSGKKKK
ncbi:MAG: DUF4136 domain-containing protein [Bacteroidetes bacterium]|nr:DUF4136 domain-containing protein [Bacteroidota bacterium]